MPETVVIEICVENLDGLLAAEQGGADRAELCASLLEGGLTPSLGMVKEALRRAKIMVRPRGGDFLYSEVEFASMLQDVAIFRDLGVPGVVFGCLTPAGTIDETRMRQLVEAARPMRVTCHRAFDMTRDPQEALEALIRCGVDRVLTSGQRSTALEGLATLTGLVKQAGDRIVILGCGRLNAEVIGHVRRSAGLREMHFSAPMQVQSGMIYRNPLIGMGGSPVDREYIHTLTNPEGVRATIAAARAG
jgi:copper homeostasis protein